MHTSDVALLLLLLVVVVVVVVAVGAGAGAGAGAVAVAVVVVVVVVVVAAAVAVAVVVVVTPSEFCSTRKPNIWYLRCSFHLWKPKNTEFATPFGQRLAKNTRIYAVLNMLQQVAFPCQSDYKTVNYNVSACGRHPEKTARIRQKVLKMDLPNPA